MEKKDEIIDLITKLEKKEITVKNNPEVLKRFEEIWISFADESDFSIQAVGFLYDGFVFGTPSIFYKYVVSKTDRTQLINKLLKSNPNIKDKTVRLKFLYEYLGLLFQKNEIDKYLLGLILSDISYQKDKKAFRYLLKYFIKQISLDYHYPSFDSFGFNLYTSSSILQYNLSLLDFIEKEDLKRTEEELQKLKVFNNWLIKSKEKIGSELAENAAAEARKKEEEKAKNEEEKKKKEKQIDIKETDEYKALLEIKEDLDAELRAANNKISDKENKIVSLNYDIRNLKIDIDELNKTIEALKQSVEEQRQLKKVVAKDASQTVLQTYEQIASDLSFSYSTFEEAKTYEELSPDLVAILKELLNNVFETLKKYGVNLG